MPVYEFACAACGGFTAWRPMAESSAPAPCPGCGAGADRVLSATAGFGRGAARPGREPQLVQRRPADPPPAPNPNPIPTGPPHGRPWMLGH